MSSPSTTTTTATTASATALPPELLYKIFTLLHPSSPPTPTNPSGHSLSKLLQAYPFSKLSLRGLDTSLFSAMRVCRYWRNMVFSVLLGEDCSGWDWRDTGDWKIAQLMLVLREVEDRCRGSVVDWGQVAMYSGRRRNGFGGGGGGGERKETRAEKRARRMSKVEKKLGQNSVPARLRRSQ